MLDVAANVVAAAGQQQPRGLGSRGEETVFHVRDLPWPAVDVVEVGFAAEFEVIAGFDRDGKPKVGQQPA
jgi:hypothetical protein